MLTIHLRDKDPAVVAAWETEFANEPAVTSYCGNILDQAADAVVSPANSFGFMDGGIDLAFSHYFGWELESNLKALLAELHFGEIPVGQAIILPTQHTSIPYMVSAPTMRIPSNISKTINVYLAFRAALIAVHNHNAQTAVPIRSILVPGLGTGVGQVQPRHAARQMKVAYNAVVHRQGIRSRNARQILNEHHELLAFTNEFNAVGY